MYARVTLCSVVFANEVLDSNESTPRSHFCNLSRELLLIKNTGFFSRRDLVFRNLSWTEANSHAPTNRLNRDASSIDIIFPS